MSVVTSVFSLNLPTWITVARLGLGAVAIGFIFAPWPLAFLAAAVVATLAGISDAADGYLARRRRATTDLGMKLDLLADKVMVNGVLFALALRGTVPLWIPLLLTARDLAVTALRRARGTQERPLGPDVWGKTKMVTLAVAVVGVLVAEQVRLLGVDGIGPAWLSPFVGGLGNAILLVAVALAIFSGGNYLVRNWRRT